MNDLDYVRQHIENIAFDNYYYLDIIHNRYKLILDNIAERIKLDEYQKSINMYRNDNSKFIEDMLGVKLKWYQKQLFNIMSKSSEIYHQIMPYKSGRKTQAELNNYMCKILRGEI